MAIKIVGTGCYIPNVVTANQEFKEHRFFNEDGTEFKQDNEVIIEKFKSITGIAERRYIENNLVNSDIATIAAKRAIEDASCDQETLDYLILAHNYGDIKHDTNQSDTVPSLAARVKHKLQIKNPFCVGYDMLFGCPGWLESLIQATMYIKAGEAKRCLVVGSETLSRVVDPHDRDSMIYSDGAGAVVLEQNDDEGGVLAHHSATFAYQEANYIYFGESYNHELSNARRYIKMYGRKIYEFAITHVPTAMKTCLDKSGKSIDEIKKIFIHQANEKMDEAIVKRFYKLYNLPMPENIMPMSIGKLGNSSVATIPTLYDLVSKGKMGEHTVNKGDIVMFASVGAGMNINAMIYQV